MGFKEQLDFLLKSKEFREWKKNNKDSYLVHCFVLVEGKEPVDWQIGYYDHSCQRITTFRIEGKRISMNPPAEVFKEDESKIKEVILEKVKIELKDALDISQKFQKEHYKGDKPLKQIFILQHLKLGQVWNATFLTQAYKTLNIKIDASTGELKEHHIVDIMDFVKSKKE